MRLSLAIKLYLPMFFLVTIVAIATLNMSNISNIVGKELKSANLKEEQLEKDVKFIQTTLMNMNSLVTEHILDNSFSEKDIKELNKSFSQIKSKIDNMKKSVYFQTKERKEILKNLEARVNGYFYILKDLPADFKDSYEDGAYSMLSLVSINKKLNLELSKLKQITKEILSKKVFKMVNENIDKYIVLLFIGVFILFLTTYYLDKQILKSLEKLKELNHSFLHFVQQKVDSVKKVDLNDIANDDIGDVIKDVSNTVEYVEEIIKEDRELKKEIEDTQREIIFTMGAIGESRSKETGNHVKRVAEYSYLLAKLYGLSEEEATLIKEASPMHDIGKVAIPDSILKKPGKLTDEEFSIMQTHAKLGYEMLKYSKRPILQAAAIIAYQHHEKYNGKGYPQGLKGDEIHIYGAITAIADVFDALGSDRVYKKAWDDERIINLFIEETGEHFHPVLANLFLANFEKFVEIREQFKDKFEDKEEKELVA
jgi:response regulator RpfG family c-di-GMP phosphodiesterase